MEPHARELQARFESAAGACGLDVPAGQGAWEVYRGCLGLELPGTAASAAKEVRGPARIGPSGNFWQCRQNCLLADSASPASPRLR